MIDVYEWYQSLNTRQKLAFWYYAKQKIFIDEILEAFLTNEKLTKKELIEFFEDEFWDDIPELHNIIDDRKVEAGIGK